MLMLNLVKGDHSLKDGSHVQTPPLPPCEVDALYNSVLTASFYIAYSHECILVVLYILQ